MVQYPQQSSNTRHWRTLYPTALILSVYFASGQSKLASPQFDWLLTSDKLIHFCVFGLLATLVLRSPLLQKCGAYAPLITMILISSLGGLDEWRQSFTPGRQVEWADWIADTFGAIFACSLYQYWPRYRSLLEWQPALKPACSAKHSRIDSDETAI